MDKYQVTGTGFMGMRIQIIGYSVSSPSGMAYTHSSFSKTAGHFIFQIGHLPFAFGQFKTGTIENGNTGTIIATVFQAFKAIDYDGNRIAFSQVAYYSTHRIITLYNIR